MSGHKFFIDKTEANALEETHRKVRASMTPEQLAVAEESDKVFNGVRRELDDKFFAEEKLRKWAEALCGISLDISEIEEFRNKCMRIKPSNIFYFLAKRGNSVPLYKTAFGTVDRVETYLLTLEKTVIDVTNNSQFTALDFRGLMKLALSRLFKRSK